MAHHFPECAVNPGASASGHVTGMPTRSLRARSAGAPGDSFRMAEVEEARDRPAPRHH